jgi:hypothetical protein
MKDAVTGATWGPWEEDNYPVVDTPTIPNYTSDKGRVPGMPATQDHEETIVDTKAVPTPNQSTTTSQLGKTTTTGETSSVPGQSQNGGSMTQAEQQKKQAHGSASERGTFALGVMGLLTTLGLGGLDRKRRN